MFSDAYEATLKHCHKDGWYFESNMKSGKAIHYHFNSLQAFWPAMQVLIGDIEKADRTFDYFFSVWYKFGGLPERVLLNSGQAHQSERHYPLRPELIESAYELYKSTKNPKYLRMGLYILDTLEKRTVAEYGHATLKNVITGDLEDYMPSYFLAETCKYLYLLFSPEDHWIHKKNYIFTTEGHVFPIQHEYRSFFSNVHTHDKLKEKTDKIEGENSFILNGICPNQEIVQPKVWTNRELLENMFSKEKENLDFEKAQSLTNRLCLLNEQPVQAANQQGNTNGSHWVLNDGRPVKIHIDHGSFHLHIGTNEELFLRQLGSEHTEFLTFEKIIQYIVYPT
eukprot:UN34612